MDVNVVVWSRLVTLRDESPSVNNISNAVHGISQQHNHSSIWGTGKQWDKNALQKIEGKLFSGGEQGNANFILIQSDHVTHDYSISVSNTFSLLSMLKQVYYLLFRLSKKLKSNFVFMTMVGQQALLCVEATLFRLREISTQLNQLYKQLIEKKKRRHRLLFPKLQMKEKGSYLPNRLKREKLNCLSSAR